MKSLMKIYVKYMLTAIVLVVGFIVVHIVLLGVISLRMYGDGGYSKYSVSQVYETLPDGLGMAGDEAVIKSIGEAGAIFAMLLDDGGALVWSYQLPENLNHPYTSSEIASFTRWYLDDYPVSVWGGEKGLLVIGYPRGSVWHYNIHQNIRDLNSKLLFFGWSFCITVLAAVLVLLISGYRYYRRMKGMTDAIDRLASGGSVHLSESGTMKEIAYALNRTSDRLTGQREALERRDETRSGWISGVSHDIRTPLSLIMGYADMIEHQLDAGEKVREKAALIRSQSIRIRDLIEDLNLTFKLEYHSSPLRIKNVSLAMVLRQVAADLLNSIERVEQYPFSIRIEPEFEAFTMEGDEQLLFRAFRNILGNSVRHNEAGCRLDVKAWMEDGYPRICFRDDGGGIPQAICTYLNEGILPEGEVHLMGLRIVRQIVEAHGGTVEAWDGGHAVVIIFRNVQISDSIKI